MTPQRDPAADLAMIEEWGAGLCLPENCDACKHSTCFEHRLLALAREAIAAREDTARKAAGICNRFQEWRGERAPPCVDACGSCGHPLSVHAASTARKEK